MTFKQAKKRLKKIAEGRFHSLRLDVTEFTSGELETKCSVYIDGETFYCGDTFEKAFLNRERALKKEEKKL